MDVEVAPEPSSDLLCTLELTPLLRRKRNS